MEEGKVAVRMTPVPGPGAVSGMVALGLLLLCACVGWGVGVYLCAPVFPCVGVRALGGGDQELLVQLRAGRIPQYFFGSAALLCCAVLCCAVLCLQRPGPWAPLLGMVCVADGGGGGDLLSCMDRYGEGRGLD